MIVTAHQPTYLPGVSVLAKIAAADAVIWLDQVRFTMPGWFNRNRLPDGTWLAVPVHRPEPRSTVMEATIAEDGWQEDHARILAYRYGMYTFYDPQLVDMIRGHFRKGDPLAPVNRLLAEQLLAHGGVEVESGWQSDYAARGSSLSSKIVQMVKAIGGDTYLASQNEAARLDRAAFARGGVDLSFFSFAGDNPCAVDPLFRTKGLSTDATQSVIPA